MKEKSTLQIIKNLYIKDGFLRFWKGASIIVCGAIPCHAAYFGCYEILKRRWHVKSGEHHPFLAGLIGCVSTILHDLILNPFEVLKQRKMLK